MKLSRHRTIKKSKVRTLEGNPKKKTTNSKLLLKDSTDIKKYLTSKQDIILKDKETGGKVYESLGTNHKSTEPSHRKVLHDDQSKNY